MNLHNYSINNGKGRLPIVLSAIFSTPSTYRNSLSFTIFVFPVIPPAIITAGTPCDHLRNSRSPLPSIGTHSAISYRFIYWFFRPFIFIRLKTHQKPLSFTMWVIRSAYIESLFLIHKIETTREMETCFLVLCAPITIVISTYGAIITFCFFAELNSLFFGHKNLLSFRINNRPQYLCGLRIMNFLI